MNADEIPDMNEAELFLYIRDDLGVPVTRSAVKWAVIEREIVPTQISGRNLFCRNDAAEWIRSRRGANRFPGRRNHKRSPAAR